MLRDRLQQLFETAIAAAQADGSLQPFEMPEVEIARPKQAEHGDYSSNIAMVAAAAIRKTTGEKTKQPSMHA